MTPEEQEAVEAEHFRELEREAYDAVAGADLRPQRDDPDEYVAPYSAVAGNAGEEGFLL